MNWAAYFKGEYGSYGVPWPGTKSWRYKCCLRHPKTTQERRNYDKKYGRKKRAPHRLVSVWDDMPRKDIEDRSWKRHRKTQYKLKNGNG